MAIKGVGRESEREGGGERETASEIGGEQTCLTLTSPRNTAFLRQVRVPIFPDIFHLWRYPNEGWHLSC